MLLYTFRFDIPDVRQGYTADNAYNFVDTFWSSSPNLVLVSRPTRTNDTTDVSSRALAPEPTSRPLHQPQHADSQFQLLQKVIAQQLSSHSFPFLLTFSSVLVFSPPLALHVILHLRLKARLGGLHHG
jgi:hypothetical protein